MNNQFRKFTKDTKNTKNGKIKKVGEKLSRLNIAKHTFLVVLLICAGGFLFNIDRMGDFGIILLQHKEFMPSFVQKFLPGGTAVFGTAVPHTELTGKIIEVYDGDTVTLLTRDNKKYRVRFYAIDAPEAAQDYGKDSRNALREKILGKEVTVTVAAVDRYQRVVGSVKLGGRNINLEMVKEGNAWYYSEYAPRRYEFSEAEWRAKRAKAGLWKTDNPEPPWKWRQKNK